MSRYFVQGEGEIHLGKADFKAQGGEGSIYVKGSTAYKIYSDPRRAIPQAKVLELSLLTQPNIIRPLDILLDGKKRPTGYSMRHIGNAFALCQLFPKAFRQRKNLTPETIFRLVGRLEEGVRHVHSKGILIVDLNEMNFLVSEDFSELFFIDVDSYQTPSFPATVLMESVRDRHASAFTAGSDWFSFAVVSFQMLVGIHPFKGSYPPLQNLPDKEKKLDARMRSNISVLHAGVSVPASCLPFDLIPPAYLDWYKAVFEEGQRLPPPASAQAALALAAPTVERYSGSHHFEITELQEFDSEIIWHDGSITITQQSIYFDGKKYPKPPFEVKAAVTPRMRHLVVAYMDGAEVRFRDLTAGQDFANHVWAEEVSACEGRFYLKQKENLFEVEFLELPRNSLSSVKLVGNVMMKSTRMFEGVAIQNLLGAYYVSVFSSPGACYQVRLRELDGYQLIEARLYRHVLIIIGTKAGRYDKLIFRFAEDFDGYDLRVTADITLTSINFTVLDSGIVLHLTDEDELEIFSRLKDSTKMKVIGDPTLHSEVKLFHTGSQALIARGSKLFKFRMRQSS
jgi:hypothetical protein